MPRTALLRSADQTTRRQSVLRRLSEVRARKDGCRAARAGTAGGTTTATAVAAPEEEASDDLVLSGRELPGSGAGPGPTCQPYTDTGRRPCVHGARNPPCLCSNNGTARFHGSNICAGPTRPPWRNRNDASAIGPRSAGTSRQRRVRHGPISATPSAANGSRSRKPSRAGHPPGPVWRPAIRRLSR